METWILCLCIFLPLGSILTVFSSVMLTLDRGRQVKDCEAQGLPLSSLHPVKSKYNVRVKMTQPSTISDGQRRTPTPLRNLTLAKTPTKNTNDEEPFSPFLDRRVCSSIYDAPDVPAVSTQPRSPLAYDVPLVYAHSDKATTISDPFVLDGSPAIEHAKPNRQLYTRPRTPPGRKSNGHSAQQASTRTKSPFTAPKWPSPVAVVEKAHKSPSTLRSAIHSPSQSQDSSYSTVNEHDIGSDDDFNGNAEDLGRLSAIREESRSTSRIGSDTRTDRLMATFVLNHEHDQAMQNQLGNEHKKFEYMKPGLIDSRGSINSAVSTVYKLQYL